MMKQQKIHKCIAFKQHKHNETTPETKCVENFQFQNIKNNDTMTTLNILKVKS